MLFLGEVIASLAYLAPDKDLHLFRNEALLLPSKYRVEQHIVLLVILTNLKLVYNTSLRIKLVRICAVILLIFAKTSVDWNSHRFS